MDRRFDVAALGEGMLEFNQTEAGQPHYLQGFGGDTSNAVIAASRAGARAAYLTRVGDDRFGRELLVHKGRAVVFESADDLHRRIDDESLDIDEHCVMVLKNCGPKGYPGMAEAGNMPLPPKVLRKGITDMVRISDARMSGTAYGTVVLHTAPEAAAGGPLALVQNGDIVELDVPNRKLHLHVSDEELARRRAAWVAPKAPLDSGYWKLYVDTVLQADEGADLDFLRGKRGAFVPKDNH